MKYLAVLLVVGGCAKPGLGPRGDGGGGGGGDLAMGGGQDSGGGGDDLATRPPDFSGLDLFGADFATTPTGDMAGMCVLFPQSGCSAGEKCYYDGTGNSCITVGTAQTGALCGGGGADDCVKGDECVGAGATSTITTCRQFCAGDVDCTQPAVNAGATAEPNNKPHCLLKLTGANVSLCSVACNPVTAAGASGCAAGLACQTWASMTVPEFSDCGQGGTVMDGGNCPNGNVDCAPGFGCVQTSAGPPPVAHCRKLCRQGMAGTDCPAGGYSCVAPSGATMFGFCCPGGC